MFDRFEPIGTMANVDFGTHYKRFVRYFWDPEPRNDDPLQSPIWCLGQQYSTAKEQTARSLRVDLPKPSPALEQEADDYTVVAPSQSYTDREQANGHREPGTADATTGEEDLGWPPDFLDDFESRFWFTYRSHFAHIRKSVDASATTSLTLAVRLRSQLVEHGGFTSDTGWGCMIRSGQCLVANALSALELGRSKRLC